MSKIFGDYIESDLNSFPDCNICKHHIDGLTCKAFETIPDDVIFGRIKHLKKHPEQDNDILFEPFETANNQ
jgi:hypothetical protein